jgi:hypothetical protein
VSCASKLGAVQLRVEAVGGQQLVVVTALPGLAVVDDEDLVSVTEGLRT